MAERRDILAAMGAVSLLVLTGCGGEGQRAECSPVALTDEHDCALCGMTITNFPGPKGWACLRDGSRAAFCSTSDLFSWAWQPESGPQIDGLRVHDLSLTEWDAPSDEVWMEAKDAWYVVGHDRRGAMGPPPAPFSEQADAEHFSREHGGDLYRYEELDMELMQRLMQG